MERHTKSITTFSSPVFSRWSFLSDDGCIPDLHRSTSPSSRQPTVMAPDRGHSDLQQVRRADQHSNTRSHDDEGQDAASILAARASAPQNFTLRSLVVGLLIGVVICFSNTYFGLQTGWISGMAMPSALLGFAWFKSISKILKFPFTPVENVLVQTVAGAVGTMPLGCGFVGVIPALELLLKPSETPDGGQGLHLSLIHI